MHSANKILCMIFFLLLPSLLPPSRSLSLSHFLSSLLGLLFLQRIHVEMASALVGSGECAVYNSSHGAGRQAGSSPSLFSFSGLFTRFPSIALIYGSLFWGGFRKQKRQAKGQERRGVCECGKCVLTVATCSGQWIVLCEWPLPPNQPVLSQREDWIIDFIVYICLWDDFVDFIKDSALNFAL